MGDCHLVISICSQPPRSTQPSIPPGVLMKKALLHSGDYHYGNNYDYLTFLHAEQQTK